MRSPLYSMFDTRSCLNVNWLVIRGECHQKLRDVPIFWVVKYAVIYIVFILLSITYKYFDAQIAQF